MHACEHVELAGFVGRHATCLSEAFAPLNDRTLYQYWSAARARLDRWGLAFRRLRHVDPKLHEEDPVARDGLGRLIEEVLLSEPLIRLLTLLLEQRDRTRGEVMASPIVRSIFLASLDSRRKALDILLKGEGLDSARLLELDALRLRVERWVDLMLGRCSSAADALLLEELAIDASRAKDFAPTTRAAAVESWPLLHASIHGVLINKRWRLGMNEDLNLEIAASVLAMLEPPLFHESGLPKSLFLLRLKNTFSDMQGWLDGFDQEDPHPLEFPGLRNHLVPRNRFQF